MPWAVRCREDFVSPKHIFNTPRRTLQQSFMGAGSVAYKLPAISVACKLPALFIYASIMVDLRRIERKGMGTYLYGRQGSDWAALKVEQHGLA